MKSTRQNVGVNEFGDVWKSSIHNFSPSSRRKTKRHASDYYGIISPILICETITYVRLFVCTIHIYKISECLNGEGVFARNNGIRERPSVALLAASRRLCPAPRRLLGVATALSSQSVPGVETTSNAFLPPRFIRLYTVLCERWQVFPLWQYLLCEDRFSTTASILLVFILFCCCLLQTHHAVSDRENILILLNILYIYI